MADEQRKTHVERIYGTDDNDGAWIDVEMLDQLVVMGRKGQKTIHKFLDNLDDMEQFRSYTTRRVPNPDDDNQYIEIKIWDKYSADSIIGVHRLFVNDPDLETSRKVEIVKITNRNIDDSFLDENDKPPSNPDDYLDAVNATDEADEDQYVYVEAIRTWNESGTFRLAYDSKVPGPYGPQVKGQKTAFEIALDNSELLPSDLGNTDAPPDAQPVRLDPLQWIVNVGWGGLAVDFGNKGEDSKYKRQA